MADAAPCRQTRYTTKEVALSRDESHFATSKAPESTVAGYTRLFTHWNSRRHEGKNTARPQRTLQVCANLGNISNRQVFLFVFFRHTKQRGFTRPTMISPQAKLSCTVKAT